MKLAYEIAQLRYENKKRFAILILSVYTFIGVCGFFSTTRILVPILLLPTAIMTIKINQESLREGFGYDQDVFVERKINNLYLKVFDLCDIKRISWIQYEKFSFLGKKFITLEVRVLFNNGLVKNIVTVDREIFFTVVKRNDVLLTRFRTVLSQPADQTISMIAARIENILNIMYPEKPEMIKEDENNIETRL